MITFSFLHLYHLCKLYFFSSCCFFFPAHDPPKSRIYLLFSLLVFLFFFSISLSFFLSFFPHSLPFFCTSSISCTNSFHTCLPQKTPRIKQQRNILRISTQTISHTKIPQVTVFYASFVDIGNIEQNGPWAIDLFERPPIFLILASLVPHQPCSPHSHHSAQSWLPSPGTQHHVPPHFIKKSTLKNSRRDG